MNKELYYITVCTTLYYICALKNILDYISNVLFCYRFITIGAFNGDAHPGNILLLKDGRLGLIDYGQVKIMTLPERIIYAKLILALSRDDKDEIIRLHFDEMNVKTKYSNKEIGYLASCFFNDRNTPDICQGMNISDFIDYMEQVDPMVQVPEAYVFANRLSIMMRGMGNAFGLQLRMSKMWEDEARNFLKSNGIDIPAEAARALNAYDKSNNK